MQTQHFVNLTNGIGMLPQLPAGAVHFVRIQSTTLEHKDWLRLFGDLDHNLLMHLALGRQCIVYDMGARRPTSKVVYYGLPLIRYALDRLWHGSNPDAVWAGKQLQIDAREPFGRIYEWLFVQGDKVRGQVKKKLHYYRNFLRGDRVNLQGVSAATERDGDKDFFRTILHAWAGAQGVGTSPNPTTTSPQSLGRRWQKLRYNSMLIL